MTSARPISVTQLTGGFAPDIDGRSFSFVEALPSVRYCYSCNIVPKTTYVLECVHSFCKSCYDQVLAKGPRCPIDKGDFDVKYVRDMVFTQKQLKATKTICHNWIHGCGFAGNVMDMAKHSSGSCGFHMVACRFCKASVRKDDMVDHFVSGGCKAEDASYESVPVLALHAGKQPGGYRGMPTLSEPTANVLLIDGDQSSTRPTKDTDCEASTVEDEGIGIEDGTPRKLWDAGKTPQPEDLELLSAEEEEKFRTRGPKSYATSIGDVFDGNLHETCENLLSLIPVEASSSSVEVGINVCPSPSRSRDSSLFRIGNRCAYLKAFIPSRDTNLRLYLAVRRSTDKKPVSERVWHKLVIKCSKHQLRSGTNRCTCVQVWFRNDGNLQEIIGFHLKPEFDVVGGAYVPFSVGDLERKNCVQDGQITVVLEGAVAS
ncbi:uncharacterized protein LOC135391952 [Ornithodoros turicata]|uniref:uncharacterized protein LOC135391952 n=1 Tax=Ornithodoros turicata TaxID=34597 RepID=UPI0031392FBA